MIIFKPRRTNGVFQILTLHDTGSSRSVMRIGVRDVYEGKRMSQEQSPMRHPRAFLHSAGRVVTRIKGVKSVLVSTA